MSEETLHRIETAITTIERVAKWIIALIAITASGVLWGAKLEFGHTNHEQRLVAIQSHNEKLDDVVSKLTEAETRTQERLDSLRRDLEGKIHGVSVLVGKSREDVKRTIKQQED